MAFKKILYRLFFLGLTILIIPALPVLIIFLGIRSADYVIFGTLNMNVSQTYSAWEIYVDFLKRILMLDLGRSTSSGQLVTGEVIRALGESLKLIVPALFFCYSIGTIISILRFKMHSSKKHWNKLEFLFYIPMIVFSYLFLYLLDFAGVNFTSNIKYVFASLILSIYPTYVVIRSFNKTSKNIRNNDFFSLHQSFGFTDRQIWRIFCKKFFVIDYLSFFENLVIFMFGFIFFVETPFGIHGMGYKFVFAIQRFDYPVIIGFCIISIIILSCIGALIDAIKLCLDPRIAHD